MSILKMTDAFTFHISTVQASAFRILVEALKEILTEANFTFDSTGIKVIAMDSSHTVLVHLKLEADSFCSYYCPESITLGIGLMNMFKLMKTMNNNSILTLYLEKQDPNRLGIKIENGDKETTTTYKLNVLDLPQNEMNIPPATFTSVITMCAADFQKICRDMYNLSDTIEVKSIDEQLFFSCKGDFAEQETIMGTTAAQGEEYSNKTKKTLIHNNSNKIVQGIYSLKFLVLFTKCTNLSNSIELYLKNDFPLILKYSCATLGTIKLVLAPQINDI